MNKVILKAINLTKSYSDNAILDNVNIKIDEGDIYGLIGENGAGKTSLFRILTGLSYKTGGDYMIFDEDNKRKEIGCLIENPMIYPHLSAYQNLEIEAIERGIKDKSLIDDTLDLVNLTSDKNKKTMNFSLGMKQRLALACALISKPRLLILDEPLNGLDPTGIIELRELLIKLNKEHNITILISSHILSEMAELATKYGFLHKGKLVKELSKEELNLEYEKKLYLKVNDIEKAIYVLEKKLNINNFMQLSEYELEIYGGLNEPSFINYCMFSNNVRVSEIYVRRNSLEDYFSKIIGGKVYE